MSLNLTYLILFFLNSLNSSFRALWATIKTNYYCTKIFSVIVGVLSSKKYILVTFFGILLVSIVISWLIVLLGINSKSIGLFIGILVSLFLILVSPFFPSSVFCAPRKPTPDELAALTILAGGLSLAKSKQRHENKLELREAGYSHKERLAKIKSELKQAELAQRLAAQEAASTRKLEYRMKLLQAEADRESKAKEIREAIFESKPEKCSPSKKGGGSWFDPWGGGDL